MDTRLEDLTAKLVDAIDAREDLVRSQSDERKRLEQQLAVLDRELQVLEDQANEAMVARQEFLGHLLGPWKIFETGGGWSADALPAALICRHHDSSHSTHLCVIRCRKIFPFHGEPFLMWEEHMRHSPFRTLGPPTNNPRRDLIEHIQTAEKILTQEGWILPQT